MKPAALPALITVSLLLSLCSRLSATPCDFDADPKSKWRMCECERLTLETAKAFCRHLPWLTVPALPNVDQTKYHMSSLSIVESGLVFLTQDAFKGHNTQMLDLSHNQIEMINSNAFRGLENKLYQLSLNHNVLSRIPARQTSNLQQLQYMYLRHNRIDQINSTTFQGTQLRNLRFLYLDDNLIDGIPSNAFVDLKLHVLTMGNNRIYTINANCFPATLWFLSLKNNYINDIPYAALASLKNLETLDFEGNNITQLSASLDVEFEKNFTLILSNNRLTHLPSGALHSFKRLKHLDLSHNQISQVHQDFLQGVGYLEILDLSSNRLVHFPTSTFDEVRSSLKKLILEENQFLNLPVALRPLTNLEYLNLKSNKLTSLKNDVVRNFKTSIKELLLSYNLLTRIPTDVLDGMKRLEHLDLSKNDIESLDRLAFGKFNGDGTSLVRLNLAGNRIKALTDSGAFLYMSALAYLDISHNLIKTIADDAFQLLPGLESLFLHNNKIEVFPSSALKKLQKLRYLVLDHNRIMAIPVKALTGLYQLERLSLSHNRIHAIVADMFPTDSLKNIRSLNFAYNSITFLAPRTFCNLSTLESVHLQGNYVKILNTYSFLNLSNLKSITFDRNRISQTFQLSFFDLPRLEFLSLRHNNLARIEPGTFSDVSSLEYLDLSNNKFQSIESSFLYRVKGLKTLDLSDNEIESFELLSFKSTLQRLFLKNNKLRHIEDSMFADFSHLQVLDLSNNGIIEIHYKAFINSPHLTDLTLSDNRLSFVRKLTFINQDILSKVDLSRNGIRKLDQMSFGNDNVYVLDLSSNQLDAIPYAAMQSVQHSLSSLDLSDNQINSLESKFFDGLRNLTYLSLKRNKIHRIEEAAFKGLHKLRFLDISHNPVNDWHPNAFRDVGHSIESVNLASTGLASMPILGQRAIRTLNLSYNTMYDLDPADLSQLTKLEVLDISHNRVGSLTRSTLNNLVNLKSLNISFNPFAMIDPERFRYLHKLETLSVHNMPNLIRFEIESLRPLRNLKELHFYGFRELEERLNVTFMLNCLPPLKALKMEIGDTALKHQLSTADTRFLRYIYIEGHSLRSIFPEAFQNIRGYSVKIVVTKTSIRTVPAEVFASMSQISFVDVDLRNNQIETLQPFVYTEPPILNSRGTVLADLHLEGNQLRCDCRLKWLKTWLFFFERSMSPEEFRDKLIRWNSTVCHSPESLKSTPVMLVDFDKMGCTGAHCTYSPILLLFLYYFLFYI